MVRAVYAPEKAFFGMDSFVLRGAFASGNSIAKEIVVTIEVPQSNSSQEPPVALSAPNETRLISVVNHTPPRMDPEHPLKIGQRHYPKESLRAREQGQCKVEVTVAADGSLKDPKILQSSGYPRLEKACLDALAGGRFKPATENGVPIEKTIAFPVVWMLTN